MQISHHLPLWPSNSPPTAASSWKMQPAPCKKCTGFSMHIYIYIDLERQIARIFMSIHSGVPFFSHLGVLEFYPNMVLLWLNFGNVFLIFLNYIIINILEVIILSLRISPIFALVESPSLKSEANSNWASHLWITKQTHMVFQNNPQKSTEENNSQ